MSIRLHLRPGRTVIAMVVSVGILFTAPALATPGQEDSKSAKITELIQLRGLARMMEQSKAAGRQQATEMVRSMTEKMFAQFPNVPPGKRTAIEAASQQFLSEVENSFDADDALRAWGRFYADGLTEQELDAILAYYRSPVGQKDVSASQAALPQFQKYMGDKRTAATNTAVANYTAALREIMNPSNVDPGPHDDSPRRSAVSDPVAPDGKFVSSSDRCEGPPGAASRAPNAPSTGRSVLCVCVDEKGTLTQDPVITESSGDSRVDSGAVKLARLDSGRYKPPAVDGKPQNGCFRFAVNFRHSE